MKLPIAKKKKNKRKEAITARVQHMLHYWRNHNDREQKIVKCTLEIQIFSSLNIKIF